jgi:anti-anti-sigma factor
MSFHFCSRPWEVRDTQDGTLVKLTQRDLDQETVTVLVDELFELVQESGRPNLYLDLGGIRLMASAVLGKVLSLDTKLRGHGGRLILVNIDPFIFQMFQAARLTEVLDIRKAEATGSVA